MRLALALPGAYCAVALVAWIDFVRLPPDGLANLALLAVVLPLTLLDLALRPADAPGRPVLMPDGLGYYAAHGVFFAAGVAAVAAGLCLLGAFLDQRRARRREHR